MNNNNNHIANFLKNLATGDGIGTSVYFLGIGGIGMSAIARYFNSRGVTVSGYDKTETTLTQLLVSEGIAVHYDDNVELVDKESLLVVYTPAIPNTHTELNYFINNGYPVVKRSEVLGMITNGSYNICVAGTHGKTTTSTMIAHILRHSEFGCNAFLGGIASNYETNFWSSKKNVSVVEADEYDRSFLRLHPDVAVITAMDPDHLDIYGTAETFEAAFVEFSHKVKEEGTLIYKLGLNEHAVFSNKRMLSYSAEDSNADCFAFNISHENGSYQFDVAIQNNILQGFSLHMGGLHNIENAVAAITVASISGVETEKIKAAVAAFKGVKRRFEYIFKDSQLVMIDDYAHHPKELTALISGAKGLFPEKKCTIVFQPHLYSRTRDFAEGFATALSLADEVLLLPIYPARELPIEGVDAEMLAQRMTDKNKVTVCKDFKDLLQIITSKKQTGDIEMIITAGAGDIDTLVQPIKHLIA
jgi:UDP-N-acetylmuramate--alanine ligase